MIDTGVLVSAFAFGGVPAGAVKKACAKALIFVSPELLQEYRDVPHELLREGKITAEQYEILITGIASVVSAATVVIPRKKLKLSRDPEDNMVLECCLAAHADFVITGDKDLLALGEIPFALQVVNPAAYLADQGPD